MDVRDLCIFESYEVAPVMQRDASYKLQIGIVV